MKQKKVKQFLNKTKVINKKYWNLKSFKKKHIPYLGLSHIELKINPDFSMQFSWLFFKCYLTA